MTKPETAAKATYAFMKLGKFDIAKLEEAIKKLTSLLRLSISSRRLLMHLSLKG
jgi:hypothetical protein